jgi:hypothetical protein
MSRPAPNVTAALRPNITAALRQTSREIRDDARATCAESRRIRERSGELRLLGAHSPLASSSSGVRANDRNGVLARSDIGIAITDIV